jgi:lysozyme
MNISEMLEVEEGLECKPYLCSEDYATVGIGWRIGSKGQSLSDFENINICKAAAYAQCEFMVGGITVELSNKLEFFNELSEARQAVLISMAYQMGLSGLLKFKNMLAAIETQRWNDAAHEGLDSRWATQTPERAERQMRTLLLGDWSQYE